MKADIKSIRKLQKKSYKSVIITLCSIFILLFASKCSMNGRIHGIVYRSDTGERIIGAIIHLGDAKVRRSSETGKTAIIAETRSGNDGSFEFQQVQPGEYYLVIAVTKSLLPCDITNSNFMTANGWTEAIGVGPDLIAIMSPLEKSINLNMNDNIKWDIDINCSPSANKVFRDTNMNSSNPFESLRDQSISLCRQKSRFIVTIIEVLAPKDVNKTPLRVLVRVNNAGEVASNVFQKVQIRDAQKRLIKMIPDVQTSNSEGLNDVFSTALEKASGHPVHIFLQTDIIEPSKSVLMFLVFESPGYDGPFTIEPTSTFICK